MKLCFEFERKTRLNSNFLSYSIDEDAPECGDLNAAQSVILAAVSAGYICTGGLKLKNVPQTI